MFNKLLKDFQKAKEKVENFIESEDGKKLTEKAQKLKSQGLEVLDIARKEIISAKKELFDNKEEVIKETKKQDVAEVMTRKPSHPEDVRIINIMDNSKRKLLNETNLNRNITQILYKEGFLYLDQIESLTIEELQAINGIGVKSAEIIKNFLDIYLESRALNSKI